MGRCENGFDSQKECQCDSMCKYYKSCCSDFEVICALTSKKPRLISLKILSCREAKCCGEKMAIDFTFSPQLVETRLQRTMTSLKVPLQLPDAQHTASLFPPSVVS